MPHVVYAHKVNRVTLSGSMWGGVEEWSTGFWLGEESADAVAPTQDEADAIRDLWTTMWTATNSHISQQYKFEQVKIAPINTNGTTDSAGVVYSYAAGSPSGGNAAAFYPSQCSLVVTLLSDRPRGLASKGRMYLPGTCAPVTGTGKINGSSHEQVAQAMETFFNGVRASADVVNDPILAAKGTGLFPELTAQNDYIESIRVGDVIDTQRRRRNQLSETYISKILV